MPEQSKQEVFRSWTKEAAIAANHLVRDMGIDCNGLAEETLEGYNAVFLDGIWLRAPYLHNGSVPILRDLFNSVAQRSRVLGPAAICMIPWMSPSSPTQSREPQGVGRRLEVNAKSGGNQGHEFNADLAPLETKALLEYLKTL